MAANNHPSMQQRITTFIQNHRETLVLVLAHGFCHTLALITMQVLNANGYHFNMVYGPDMTSRDIQWHACLSALYSFLLNTGHDLRRILRTHHLDRLDRAALCIQRRYRTHALRALVERPAVTTPPATIEHTQHVTKPTNQNTWFIRPAAGAA